MRIFRNRKASFEYTFLEDFEAGIELKGAEIKSIRNGHISFLDSYAKVEMDQVWLVNMFIGNYEKESYFALDTKRERRLLLTKREIKKLKKKVLEQGLTIIPKKLYINDRGFAKVTISLSKGKRSYDKRESLKRKDEKRELAREFKKNNLFKEKK